MKIYLIEEDQTSCNILIEENKKLYIWTRWKNKPELEGLMHNAETRKAWFEDGHLKSKSSAYFGSDDDEYNEMRKDFVNYLKYEDHKDEIYQNWLKNNS